MSIFTNFLRRQQDEAMVGTPMAASHADEPPLILLLPDTSGVASYSCFSFHSNAEAGRFLEEHMRGRLAPDATLFWGLCSSPGLDSETIVLIRGEQPNAAHAFSFTDLPTARDFVSHEVAFGLALAQVAIYWVAPARVEIDSNGRVAIVPVRSELPEDGTSQVVSPIVAAAQPEEDEEIEAQGAGFDNPIIEFAAIPSRFRRHGDTTQWWVNMIEAMEEALDACVAQKVAGRLAWRRLSSELAVAATMHVAMAANTASDLTDDTPVEAPAEEATAPEATGPEATAPEDPHYARDFGDDPWFVPRPEWRNRPDGPFRGFNSPRGRF